MIHIIYYAQLSIKEKQALRASGQFIATLFSDLRVGLYNFERDYLPYPNQPVTCILDRINHYFAFNIIQYFPHPQYNTYSQRRGML